MLATAADVLRESYTNVRLTARVTCRLKAKVCSPVAVVAPALGRWVSLANRPSKAALYDALSRSGGTRCYNVEQQSHRHTAFTLLQ